MPPLAESPAGTTHGIGLGFFHQTLTLFQTVDPVLKEWKGSVNNHESIQRNLMTADGFIGFTLCRLVVGCRR